MNLSIGVFTMLVSEGNIILELFSMFEHWHVGGEGSGGEQGPSQPPGGRLAPGQSTETVARVQPRPPCSHPQHYGSVMRKQGG